VALADGGIPGRAHVVPPAEPLGSLTDTGTEFALARVELGVIQTIAVPNNAIEATMKTDADSSRRALLTALAPAGAAGLFGFWQHAAGSGGPASALPASKASARTNASLPGFEYQQIQTSGAMINVASRGNGPPLLLLHGYPESHLIWRGVAPQLAKEYYVVCPDLRGYGDSSKPEGASDHSNYSKRVMAQDMIEVMAALGHRQFLVAGHDRGGRVAYRLALDHPEAVKRLALLDIVSTRAVYDEGGTEMAVRYFHWYLFIQPRPLPERLLGSDPAFVLKAMLPPDAPLPEYLRTFGTPEGIHASCEDYRAGYAIDLPQDRADAEAGRKIKCPTLILWGRRGAVGAVFKPLEAWRDLIESPQGEAIDCGHFIPEERPEETLRALHSFFRA
jgi:haloacetate dehalogenase